MNKAYERPTYNMAALLSDNLTEKLITVMKSMAGNIETLLAADAYAAIHSGVIQNTPDDFGIVRFAANLHKSWKANPAWLKVSPAERNDLAKYFEGETTVQLVINIPGIGQLRATAAQVTSKGTFPRERFTTVLEAGLATLWYHDIMELLDKVIAENLLGAPQLVEKMV